MKFSIAVILVVLALATAEPPRPRPVLSRQSAAPYNPRGWRPSGPAFNLPLTSQAQVQQTYGAPAPAPSYGPPPDGSDAYTTEQPTTTDYPTEDPTNQFLVEAENLELDPRENKEPKQNKKTGKDEEQPKASLLLFLPQKQNLLYAAAAPQAAAPLVSVPQANFARLQAVPATLQIVPYSSAVSSSVYTPYSASVVQFYQ